MACHATSQIHVRSTSKAIQTQFEMHDYQDVDTEIFSSSLMAERHSYRRIGLNEFGPDLSSPSG